MKNFFIFAGFLFATNFASAQAVMYARSDYGTGKGFYSVVYGVPLDNADMLAKQKLLEKGCPQDKQILKQAESNKKGYGAVIKSIEKSGTLEVELFGAAFGCTSHQEAEQKAVENIKKFHIDWDSKTYEVLMRIQDL